MQVWIVSNATPPVTYYLAEDPAGTLRQCTSPDGLVISAERSVQITPRFRAANKSVKDRLNVSHRVAFKVARLWTDEATAAAFMLTHAATMPGSGTLNFKQISGSTTTTKALSNAVVTSAESKQMGATTYHTYDIVGGNIA